MLFPGSGDAEGQFMYVYVMRCQEGWLDHLYIIDSGQSGLNSLFIDQVSNEADFEWNFKSLTWVVAGLLI